MPKGAKYGGRVKGTPNKATADIKALAQSYAPEVLAELARLATQAQSESARVAAGTVLLDRGYGKAAQEIAVTGKDGGAIAISFPVLAGDKPVR